MFYGWLIETKRHWVGKQKVSASFANWFASPSPDFDSTLAQEYLTYKILKPMAGWGIYVTGKRMSPTLIRFSRDSSNLESVFLILKFVLSANEGRSNRPMNLGKEVQYWAKDKKAFNVGRSTADNTWSTYGHPRLHKHSLTFNRIHWKMRRITHTHSHHLFYTDKGHAVTSRNRKKGENEIKV